MSMQGGGGYQSPWGSQTVLPELDGTMAEMEPLGELTEVGFEPQTRARSNTWPLPRPDNYVDPSEDTGSKKNSTQNLSGNYHICHLANQQPPGEQYRDTMLCLQWHHA